MENMTKQELNKNELITGQRDEFAELAEFLKTQMRRLDKLLKNNRRVAH